MVPHGLSHHAAAQALEEGPAAAHGTMSSWLIPLHRRQQHTAHVGAPFRHSCRQQGSGGMTLGKKACTIASIMCLPNIVAPAALYD